MGVSTLGVETSENTDFESYFFSFHRSASRMRQEDEGPGNFDIPIFVDESLARQPEDPDNVPGLQDRSGFSGSRVLRGKRDKEEERPLVEPDGPGGLCDERSAVRAA